MHRQALIHPTRRGLTLLEIMIGATIMSLVVIVVSSTMLSAQRAVTDAAALQEANARARWIAEQVVAELRDMNYDSQDVSPFVFSEVSAIEYRRVSGYSSGAVQLSPDRGSGKRRLELVGTDLKLRPGPTGTSLITLASRVAELKLTLIPENAATGVSVEQLKVEVVIERLDSRGNTIRGSADLTVQLRNQISTL